MKTISKLTKLFASLIIVLFAIQTSFAQIPVTVVSCGDTAVFGLNNAFLGKLIQWQESNDNMSWTDISGATSQNVEYIKNGIETKYIRAQITSPNCSAPIYSSLNKLTQVPVIQFNGDLYVHPTDNSSGIIWDTEYLSVQCATSETNGEANTIEIIANQGAYNSAAKICGELSSNGFDDWYLPAKDELYAIYLEKESIGGFFAEDYWSSTKFGVNTSWVQSFANGDQNPLMVLLQYKVRCVRR